MPKTTPQMQRSGVNALMDPNTLTLTIKQFCEITNISKSTVTIDYKTTGKIGGFCVVRVGKRILIPANQIREAWGITL